MILSYYYIYYATYLFLASAIYYNRQCLHLLEHDTTNGLLPYKSDFFIDC